MRLIDADALMSSVLKWLPPDPCGQEDKEYPFETDICVSMLQEIAEAPTIEPEPEWIPVSERLPEPNEMVLISVNGEVDADWIAVDNTGYGCWYRTMRHAIDIDAWMPLPESYKEKKDD